MRRRGVRPSRHSSSEYGEPCFGAIRDGKRRRMHIRVRIIRRRHHIREFRRRRSRYLLELRSPRNRLHRIVLPLSLIMHMLFLLSERVLICEIELYFGRCDLGMKSCAERKVFFKGKIVDFYGF